MLDKKEAVHVGYLSRLHEGYTSFDFYRLFSIVLATLRREKLLASPPDRDNLDKLMALLNSSNYKNIQKTIKIFLQEVLENSSKYRREKERAILKAEKEKMIQQRAKEIKRMQNKIDAKVAKKMQKRFTWKEISDMRAPDSTFFVYFISSIIKNTDELAKRTDNIIQIFKQHKLACPVINTPSIWNNKYLAMLDDIGDLYHINYIYLLLCDDESLHDIAERAARQVPTPKYEENDCDCCGLIRHQACKDLDDKLMSIKRGYIPDKELQHYLAKTPLLANWNTKAGLPYGKAADNRKAQYAGLE